jgi:small basic protein (TIGR04137 family)
MSLHRSLVSKNRLVRRRNVLTRDERVKKLTEQGKLEEEGSVYGLPKVKVRKVRKRVKAKKKKEEVAEAAAAAETEEKAEGKAEEKKE